MTYTVEIVRSAQRQLTKIDRPDQSRIISAVRAGQRSTSPRQQKVVRTFGLANSRRPYRVIYEISDERLLVLVVTIGHRKEVYR